MEEQIKNLLRTTTKGRLDNGWCNRTEFGYHSFKLDGIDIDGQRDCKKRLDKWGIDFTDKKVIDLACNVGGMLFHMNCKRGLGIDVDSKCINVAKKISTLLNRPELEFKQMDLKNLEDLVLDFEPDYILCLNIWNPYTTSSLNWAISNAPYTIFETSSAFEMKFGTCISYQSDDDNTKNYGRKTYLINNLI